MNQEETDCPICGKQLPPSIDPDSHVILCLQKATGSSSPARLKATKNNTECDDPWAFLRNRPESTKRKSSSTASKSLGSHDANKKLKVPMSSVIIESERHPDSTSTVENNNLVLGLPKFPLSYLASVLREGPLAERMRPMNFGNFVGQEDLMNSSSPIRKLLDAQDFPSMILWGPPGCGKTTLARIIARRCEENSGICSKRFQFVKLSATTSNLGEVKKCIEIAKNEKSLRGHKTIIFMDEIHRFNKLQQDIFLPHVENGSIVLIGATTENPSFSLNSALLSRCQVLVFQKLSIGNIRNLLYRALFELQLKSPDVEECAALEKWISVEDDAIDFLCGMCDGDARTAINALQMAVLSVLNESEHHQMDGPELIEQKRVRVETVKGALQRSHFLYDKGGDQHYHIISALHKSVRGSDENATVYWLARMLESGEDPRYVARRLIRMASEDIGLADPGALPQAVAAAQAAQLLGMPECDVILAQAAVYLARAPKSIEVYAAYSKAKEVVRNQKGAQPSVPLHLRNAPTPMMKNLGYGKDYKYPPDFEGHVQQDYLPDELIRINFFRK